MDYFGHDFDKQHLELAGIKIDASHRADAADLLTTCWFDYRRLTPVQATYLYAHCYKQSVLSFAESYHDIEKASTAGAFYPKDIFQSRDMTSMWLARCAADRIGMPYDLALTWIRQRALERTFESHPRPNQCYGEALELDLAEHWSQRKTYELQVARGSEFRMADKWGILRQEPHPHVLAHEQFVIDQIKARPAPHTGLLGRMFRENVLSPRRVRATQAFPVEVIALAQNAAEALAT
jgi:hypothetical protein